MLGFKPNIYWIATWTVIAPIFIIVSPMLQISWKLIWHIIVLESENSTKNRISCKILPLSSEGVSFSSFFFTGCPDSECDPLLPVTLRGLPVWTVGSELWVGISRPTPRLPLWDSVHTDSQIQSTFIFFTLISMNACNIIHSSWTVRVLPIREIYLNYRLPKSDAEHFDLN